MSNTAIWAEKVTIPTYEIGEAEKNPIFLDKRVYQGSMGKVYPYPTIEKISDEKVDKEYEAVFLERPHGAASSRRKASTTWRPSMPGMGG